MIPRIANRVGGGRIDGDGFSGCGGFACEIEGGSSPPACPPSLVAWRTPPAGQGGWPVFPIPGHGIVVGYQVLDLENRPWPRILINSLDLRLRLGILPAH